MDWLINGYLGKPGEDKLWKVGCHSGPVSRCNGLNSTTGSKANATGDERPRLPAAIACASTLSVLLSPSLQKAVTSNLNYMQRENYMLQKDNNILKEKVMAMQHAITSPSGRLAGWCRS